MRVVSHSQSASPLAPRPGQATLLARVPACIISKKLALLHRYVVSACELPLNDLGMTSADRIEDFPSLPLLPISAVVLAFISAGSGLDFCASYTVYDVETSWTATSNQQSSHAVTKRLLLRPRPSLLSVGHGAIFMWGPPVRRRKPQQATGIGDQRSSFL